MYVGIVRRRPPKFPCSSKELSAAAAAKTSAKAGRFTADTIGG